MYQKKALITALFSGAAILGCSAIANAEVPGFYMGADVGYASQSYSNPNLSSLTPLGLVAVSSQSQSSSSKNGFGGGIDLGWQWNDNFGVELGYLYWPKASYSATTTGFSPTLVSVVNSASVSSKEQAIDVMLKAMIPFGCGFGGYVKLGGADVQNKQSFSATSSTAFSTTRVSFGQTNTQFKPIGAFGFTYDINDALVANLGFTYLFGSNSGNSGNSSNPNSGANNGTLIKGGVPRAYLTSLGLTYYFGCMGDDT